MASASPGPAPLLQKSRTSVPLALPLSTATVGMTMASDSKLSHLHSAVIQKRTSVTGSHNTAQLSAVLRKSAPPTSPNSNQDHFPRQATIHRALPIPIK